MGISPVLPRFRSANEQTEYQRNWGSQNVAIADPDGEFTKLISDAPRDKKRAPNHSQTHQLKLAGPRQPARPLRNARRLLLHSRSLAWPPGIIVGFASTQKAFELESTDRKFVRTKSFNEGSSQHLGR